MKHFCKILFTAIILFSYPVLKAEDGYRLWLRYDLISELHILNQYNKSITGWMTEGKSPTITVAGNELQMGLKGLLGRKVPAVTAVRKDGIIIAGTPESSGIIASLKLDKKLAELGDEGYLIIDTLYKKKKVIVIVSNKDAGILYGIFHFLRLIQTHWNISAIKIVNSPKTNIRLLNHWDNLNRTVERGYAGISLWDWESLPDSIDPRYTDYARANASVGINGTVLTNVNANAKILTSEYLVKVAALANVFRPYGIKVYLTARFSTPVETGKLKTADPLDPDVINWWKKKADEIYSLIPDFGGFLVKANSEGQPGPQTYNRTHADGANMLADAVAPHNGIVMWRAFVYDNNVPDDRAKQAYNEFVPLDGKFRKNVLIQVKNGPVDFQPREPFSPLYGAMTQTPVMPEFQITQEYLGASVHLVFLAPLFEECLKADTYARGKGSVVAKIVDGTLYNHELTAMAGVTNIGNNRNWTGHPFAQANWYAFGRLAWDPYMNSEEIAGEWIRMSITNDTAAVRTILTMMLRSREITVNYMTPLGLHHQMYAGHHYGPGPWVKRGRADQTSVYFSRADSIGLGFDRTTSGSKAVEQYFSPVRELFNDINSCPENLLLWFHHVPWDHKMSSGRILWDELCFRYGDGVKSVSWLHDEWNSVKSSIDNDRFDSVSSLLIKQERDAKIWRDACILYFQTFSKRPIPAGVSKPENNLQYYIDYRYTDIPGISRR
ncbi:MAG TPA: alpha-glucuronidase family glycosyl hydrolase [Bacteroidales bacterium]|nr:alpha-glucuronidase family glycosyl hydrolase [Bacteroidales bacterium]